MDRALTSLILLSVPGVPGAHKLTGVLGVSVNGRQDVLTERFIKNTQMFKKREISAVFRKTAAQITDFLPKFIVSIEALRLDIVNCKQTKNMFK